MSKARFRKLALQRRKAICDRDKKSEFIADRVLALDEFRSAKHIFLYLSIRSEVQTRRIVESVLANSQKACYIPYCVGEVLKIFPLTAWDQLEPKSFGVLEPKADQIEKGFADLPFPIELALIPGVAFDLELNRMGYGRGYFDRLLRNSVPDARRVALAFDEQVVASVPTDQFDEPMHQIVTDTRTIGLYLP